jgi:hypothetical protein
VGTEEEIAAARPNGRRRKSLKSHGRWQRTHQKVFEDHKRVSVPAGSTPGYGSPAESFRQADHRYANFSRSAQNPNQTMVRAGLWHRIVIYGENPRIAVERKQLLKAKSGRIIALTP